MDWPTNPREVSDRIVEDALRLLANGYEPIPLITKVPLQGNWQGREIARAEIKKSYGGGFWPRVTNPAGVEEAARLHAAGSGMVFLDGDGFYRTKAFADGLGIRMRGLLGIDADVDCPFMQKVIEDVLRQHLGEVWWDEHLLRFGNGAKTMRIAGISSPEPFPKFPALVKPGEDLEDEGTAAHKIEVYPGTPNPHTGNPIRQIGVYGRCGPDRLYSYDSEGPAQVRRDELPVVARDDLLRAVVEIESQMRAAGWVDKPKPKRVQEAMRRAKSGGTESNMLRMLAPDQIVVEQRKGPIRVDQLEAWDRVRMYEITGEGPEADRGWVFIDEYGVCVYDHADGTKYRLELEYVPRIDADQFKALGEKLAPRLVGSTARKTTRAPRKRPVEGPAADPLPIEAVDRDALAARLTQAMTDPFNPRLGERLNGGMDGLRNPTTTAYDASLAKMLAERRFTAPEIAVALREFSPCGRIATEGSSEAILSWIDKIAADAVARLGKKAGALTARPATVDQMTATLRRAPIARQGWRT